MTRLERALGFFQDPTTLSFWDVFAIVVLLLFLVVAFILALREWTLRTRAKSLVRQRYGPADDASSKRIAPRLLVRIPARVMVDKHENVLEAEVLDVSTGGIRLLFFDIPREIKVGEHIDVMTRDPLFTDMQRTRVEVLKVNAGPRSTTPMVHGRWEDLSADTMRRLSRDIRRRLLHGP